MSCRSIRIYFSTLDHLSHLVGVISQDMILVSGRKFSLSVFFPIAFIMIFIVFSINLYLYSTTNLNTIFSKTSSSRGLNSIHMHIILFSTLFLTRVAP